MGDNAQYIQFGFILISVANLIMIGLLVLVFALAVWLRIPGESQVSTLELPGASVANMAGVADAAGGATSNWEEQP